MRLSDGVGAKLLLCWLVLVFLTGLGLRFLPRGHDPQALQESLRLPERLALMARFSPELPNELKAQLWEAAKQVESDPVRRRFLEGESLSADDRQRLSDGYRAMLEYQEQPSPDKAESLRAMAVQASARLKLCLGLVGALVILALVLSFAGSAERAVPPLPFSSHGPLGVLVLFMAWDTLNLFGMSFLIDALGLVRKLPPLALLVVAQLAGYVLLLLLLKAACARQTSWNLALRFPTAWVGRGYFACYALVLSVNVAVAALSGRAPASSNPLLSLFMHASPAEVAVLAVMVVAIGPAFEELLFRGWLLGGLRRFWGDGWALLATSVLFAVIHGDPWATPALFALGMSFGWVYLRTGSLYASIVLHAMWNATTFIFLLANMP